MSGIFRPDVRESKKGLKPLELFGVRVSPRVLIFRNAYEGKTYREKITFQNISGKRRTIRTGMPSSFSFKVVKPLQRDIISSGLSCSCQITFTYSSLTPVLRAELPIYVNDHVFPYELIVDVSTGIIHPVPRSIDFGIVNAGHSMNVQKLQLHNKGYRTTKFEIDLSNENLDLVIKPLKGFIPGKGFTDVKIDFIGFQEGIFFFEIWIKCENPFRVPVTVNVIIPKLNVCVPTDTMEKVTPIIFAHTYAGCQSQQTLIFLNRSTLKSMYVVVPEYKNEIMSLNKVLNIESKYGCFKLSPVDGHLEPYERRELKLWFTPKPITDDKEEVYVVFFRVIAIDCLDVEKITPDHRERKPSDVSSYEDLTPEPSNISQFSSEPGSIENLAIPEASANVLEVKRSATISDSIRLCLFGVGKPVQVQIEPEELYIGTIVMNTTEEREIMMKNHSPSLPIYFQYRKIAFVEAKPKKGLLKKLESAKIRITISPKAPGVTHLAITFDLLYENLPRVHSQGLVIVGELVLDVYLTVTAKTIQCKPKFCMGITPLITNEVGLMTDNIRFTDVDIEKPKTAIVGYYLDKCVENLDNAVITFPNDRPKTLRVWTNPDDKYKTIFAELERPTGIKDEYMLSDSEKNKKIENKSYYALYLNQQRCNKETKQAVSERVYHYDVSEAKLLMIQNMLPFKSSNQITGKKSPALKVFSLLTPIQIFFVTISPSCIKTGKVTVHSKSNYKITIENLNTFPVKIVVRTHNVDLASFITNLPQTLYLGNFNKCSVEIEFHPTSPGRFNTVVDITLNDVHYLSIPFQSDVCVPSVTLETNEFVVGGLSCPQGSKYINLHNILNVPVHFKWIIPESSCFTVLPETGSVPNNRFITCEINYTPNHSGRTTRKLSVCCAQGLTQYINVSACMDKCDLEILEPRLCFPHVPLNIRTKKINILRNHGDEPLLFILKNTKPFPGVCVDPGEGVVGRRADFYLTVSVDIQAMIEFECKVEIGVLNGPDMEFVISANVECGVISFHPVDSFPMKRIAAESIDIFPFVVENKGMSPVHLTFDKEICPEMVISYSMEINKQTSQNAEVNLSVGESAHLYIIFSPLDVSVNKIYLPYIINGIVGPPLKDDPESLYPSTYVDKNIPMYDYEEGCKIVSNIKRLPQVGILLLATRHILRFSRTLFKFTFFPHPEYRSQTSWELKVKNDYHFQTEFCIRIDDMEPHFEITCKQTDKVKFTENALVVTLETEEEINFIVQFKHSDPGSYFVNLPIYIRNYEHVFNYLQLTAEYPRASFVGPRDIHLQHIPLYMSTVHSINLQCLHHLNGCIMDVKSLVPGLRIELPDDCSIPQSTYLSKDIMIKLEFTAEYPTSYFTGVRLWCTCGGESTMRVTGCADTSIITTHIYLFGDKLIGEYRTSTLRSQIISKLCLQKSSLCATIIYRFPYFPSEADPSPYAKYMFKIVTIAEKWLFHQVFSSAYYISIPEQISQTFPLPRKIYDTEDNPKMLVVLKIIVNILGPQALSYLVTKTTPNLEDDLDRVYYYHSIYINVLKFLSANGATVPHVKAKYLLSYNDYFIYMNKIRIIMGKATMEPVSKTKFLARSKQCWVDVVLQIFKSLILSRIGTLCTESSYRCLTVECQMISVNPTNPETVLLTWLTEQYQKQKEAMLQLNSKGLPEYFTLEDRSIDNFTSQLSDGLVFIALTISYCPYLCQYLKNVYLDVASPEKAFHNAAQLIMAWNMIKCSFVLTPTDITQPLAVHMIMFVTYLYETLPTLVPKDVINFRVALSHSQDKEIIIQNTNAMPLYYNVVYLNNPLNSFSLRNDKLLVIPPKKAVNIKINYHAKKIVPIKATIIFCGDTVGKAYCKSIAYTLIGTPDFSEEFSTINLSMPLYTSATKVVELRTPYHNSVSYDICYAYTLPDPEISTSYKIYNWKEQKSNIIPRVMYTDQTKLECNNRGTGYLEVLLFSIRSIKEQLWLFFFNKEIGDFYIKLVYEPIDIDHIERITATALLPPNWENDVCTCKPTTRSLTKCPRIITVQIPRRNNLFWNVVVESVLASVETSERECWRKYLDSEFGPHLLQWLFMEHQQSSMKNMFEANVTYSITCDNPDAEFQEKVLIENIRADENVEISVHIKNCEKKRRYVDFSLISEGTEIRLYKIDLRKATITSITE